MKINKLKRLLFFSILIGMRCFCYLLSHRIEYLSLVRETFFIDSEPLALMFHLKNQCIWSSISSSSISSWRSISASLSAFLAFLIFITIMNMTNAIIQQTIGITISRAMASPLYPPLPPPYEPLLLLLPPPPLLFSYCGSSSSSSSSSRYFSTMALTQAHIVAKTIA